MRVSELAESTGVPVHTLKFYLREGVLMAGRSTSRTRSEYGPEHVERVRLVRALVEQGGISVAGVRTIVAALDSPPPSRHELLGTAHLTLAGPEPAVAADTDSAPEVLALLEGLGWMVWADGPFLAEAARAVDAARAGGVALTAETLGRYAGAMRAVAEADLDVALAATSAAEALHTVVVGTVLVDPLLVALRRIAQEAVSAGRA